MAYEEVTIKVPTNEVLFQVCKLQVSETMSGLTEEQLNTCAQSRYEALYRRVLGDDSQPWEDAEKRQQKAIEKELNEFFKSKGEPWSKIL